jgi:hypothetical protein
MTAETFHWLSADRIRKQSQKIYLTLLFAELILAGAA